jgi:phosphoribosylanthranilate isomerase
MVELAVLPRVKVCGLARAEDVLGALAAGADALGFVFHPASPRCIAPELAGAVASLLPAWVLTVAVVVEADPSGAAELLRDTGLRAVQLCGDQRPAEWTAFGAPILRRVAVEAGAEQELDAWRAVAAGFVLDHPASAGGSGLTVDRRLAARFCTSYPCLLAGGLDAANVAEAIRVVRPSGVDASSRLERAPGCKDPAAVRAFVAAALDTFAALEP